MEITPQALSVYGLSCIEPRTFLQQSVGRKALWNSVYTKQQHYLKENSQLASFNVPRQQKSSQTRPHVSAPVKTLQRWH